MSTLRLADLAGTPLGSHGGQLIAKGHGSTFRHWLDDREGRSQKSASGPVDQIKDGTRMAELDDALAQYSIEAIRSSAGPLGVEPLALAKRLHDREILRLIHLLNAVLPQVSTPGLRHRIKDILSSVTDGKFPMFGKPETDLDWALQTLRQRREKIARDESADGLGD